MSLEDAIRLAMRQCMEENVLKDFLQERGEEVMRVMTLDFTFERRLELQTAEAAEEGEKIGMQKLVRKKLLKHKSLEQIADELEETPETIRLLYEQVQKELQQNM